MDNVIIHCMSKKLLLLLSLTVILLTAYLTLAINAPLEQFVSKREVDTAINQAMLLYRSKIATGEDLSNGPCLSDALMPNWVVDIAHNPRLAIDDLPENQCPSFREGRSDHFVELDLGGSLIRAE